MLYLDESNSETDEIKTNRCLFPETSNLSNHNGNYI